MARPLLPPRYVHAPAAIVYSDLPKSIIVTGVRIWGLGWKYEYRKTGLVSLQEVCEICGLSRTQLYEHLARLVDTGVLRYTNIDGQFTFQFDWGTTGGATDSAREARAGPSPENRTERTVSVVGVSSSLEESLPHEKQQQQDTHIHAVGGSGGGDRASGFPDTVSGILDRMGVAEPTKSELLEIDWVNGYYLMRWLEWFEDQNELGIGWVITQIRHGTLPPEEPERNDRQRYLEWAGQSV